MAPGYALRRTKSTRRTGVAVERPSLHSLHAEQNLSQAKLSAFRRVDSRDLIRSLEPGQPGCLKARPDGTLLDGHHRILVLRERGVDVDGLPRVIMEREET